MLRLDKIEAARRHLQTAVFLYFEDADTASVHTLAAAAYEVVRRLNSKAGGRQMARDYPGLKPANLKRWRKIHSHVENFFKHADKDPREILEFDPKITEDILLEACYVFLCLTTPALDPLILLYLSFVSVKGNKALRGTAFINALQLPFVQMKTITRKEVRDTIRSAGFYKYFGQSPDPALPCHGSVIVHKTSATSSI